MRGPIDAVRRGRRGPLATALSLRDGAPEPPSSPDRPALEPPDLHELTQSVIDSGFDEQIIGELLLALARRPGGINDAIKFTAIIAKAAATRQDRERRRGAPS